MADSANVKTVRKIPVEVQAVEIERVEQLETIADWCGGSVNYENQQPKSLTIATLEGPQTVGTGWWVIRGVEGEFYPCKVSVFQKSYEVLS